MIVDEKKVLKMAITAPPPPSPPQSNYFLIWRLDSINALISPAFDPPLLPLIICFLISLTIAFFT